MFFLLDTHKLSNFLILLILLDTHKLILLDTHKLSGFYWTPTNYPISYTKRIGSLMTI
jgi:hypothetical protein